VAEFAQLQTSQCGLYFPSAEASSSCYFLMRGEFHFHNLAFSPNLQLRPIGDAIPLEMV